MKTREIRVWALAAVACLLVCMGAMASSYGLSGKGDASEEEKPDYDLAALAEAVEKYDEVGSFHDGLARVQIGDKYGFINKMGKEVIPSQYDEVSPFSDGLAAVRIGAKCGFINTKGEEVIPCKYDWEEYFVEEKVRLLVISSQYDWTEPFSEGLAAVLEGKKWGFINKEGELVIPCQYDRVRAFSEGLAVVKKGDRYGYVDKKGNDTFSVK